MPTRAESAQPIFAGRQPSVAWPLFRCNLCIAALYARLRHQVAKDLLLQKMACQQPSAPTSTITGLPRDIGSQPQAKAERTTFSMIRWLTCGRRNCGCSLDRRDDGMGNSRMTSRSASCRCKAMLMPFQPSAVHHCGSRCRLHANLRPSTWTTPSRSRV